LQTHRRIQDHLGEVVVAAMFLVAMVGGLGVNAFLNGQSALFGGYGYGPPGSPSAPTGLQASGDDTVVNASWQAPADEGASPVTGYVVYLSSAGSLVDSEVVGPTTFSHQFTGLDNGTTYEVWVSAFNAAGEGPTAGPASALPAGPPQAPTITSTAPGDETITVNWIAPVDDGGSAITGYTVNVTPPSGAPAVPSQTVANNVFTAVFTGLLNQQTYTFTVTATNSLGSATSAPVSDAPNGPIVPGAPVINAATVGDGSVTVHWTAPASNGGAPITSYEITVTRPGFSTTVTSATSPVTISGLLNFVEHSVVVRAQNSEGFGPFSQPRLFTPGIPPPDGYWLLGLDGGVFAFGNRGYFGGMAGQFLAEPVVAMAGTPNGGGYWMVALDGGVFAFGNAPYKGSMAGQPLAAPIVGIVGTPSGQGYWLVASDGGVFAFGDAIYFGSMGGQPLNSPIVAIIAMPNGLGYWLIGADGGVFAFGLAPFAGSTGSSPLNEPVIDGDGNLSGDGYLLAALDGGIFAFDAPFHGALPPLALAAPVIGIESLPNDTGYHLAGLDGGVFAKGAAQFYGSMVGVDLAAPIIAIA
jgi:Fibronectin type III domain